MIKLTLILQGVPPTKFRRAKKSKIRRDIWQLSTLIANVTGMRRLVENLNSTWSTTFHPLLGEQNWVNFGPLTKKLYTLMLNHPAGLFSGDYNSAGGLSWALPHISSCLYISTAGDRFLIFVLVRRHMTFELRVVHLRETNFSSYGEETTGSRLFFQQLINFDVFRQTSSNQIFNPWALQTH